MHYFASGFVVRYNVITPLIFFCRGLSRFNIWAMVIVICSLDMPALRDLNFCTSSFVVIGFLIRYRRTASSVKPSLPLLTNQKNNHLINVIIQQKSVNKHLHWQLKFQIMTLTTVRYTIELESFSQSVNHLFHLSGIKAAKLVSLSIIVQKLVELPIWDN